MWGYLDDPRLCLFCDVVHESLVCSEQLNWALFIRKILHVLQILQFSSIFWGTQTQLLKRFKHSLMLQKNTRCIKSRGVKTFEQDEDVHIFLVLLKYIFFPCSTALQKQQKLRACFPEDKLSTIYLIFKFKKFSPPRLLMHRVSFWSISECLNLFNSCVWVPQKMLENWRICRTWRIFLMNRAQFNCSEQTRDSWTTSQNKHSRGSSR